MSARVKAPKLADCPGYEPTCYEPKEYFSPSSISLSRRCLRRWGFRYLMGIKEVEIPYEYFTTPEAEAEVKTLPENLRMLWYSMRSKALGKAVHAKLERYFLTRRGKWLGRKVRWGDGPGKIARAMADMLPHPSECEEIQTEQEITIDCTFYGGGIEPIVFTGLADLFVKVAGYWRLYDYKSTKAIKNDPDLDYNYVKTVDELREDEQAGLYSLHAMQKAGVDNIECEWVYGRTKGKVEATSTKFVMGLSRSQRLVRKLIEDADRLRKIMRSGKKAMDLEGNPEACQDFGRTCEHHITNGGPCTVKQSLGAQLVQIRKKEESKAMASTKFEDQLKAAKKEATTSKPGVSKSKAKKPKDEEEEEEDEEEEEEEEDEADEEEDEEEEKPAKSSAKKAAKKVASKSKASKKDAPEVDRAESATVTVASGGVTITISADLSEAEAVAAIADKISEEIFA